MVLVWVSAALYRKTDRLDSIKINWHKRLQLNIIGYVFVQYIFTVEPFELYFFFAKVFFFICIINLVLFFKHEKSKLF